MRFSLKLSIVAVLTFGLAALFYHYAIDGRLPKTSTYNIDLDDLRRLASAPAKQRPSAIEVEIIARDEIPRWAAQAGQSLAPLVMARSLFRLKSDWGNTLIDAGFDPFIAKKFNTGKVFDNVAYARVVNAVGEARRIVVTHEHPDHIGLLGRYSPLSEISEAIRLTETQLAATAMYTDDSVPLSASLITTVDISQPVVVAPGVVMVAAPGHTPGNVMYYVRMHDNSEVLFVGDVVWNMSNIRDARGRPRMVQQFLMQTLEDRQAIYEQLAALVDLSEEYPNLILIPSHDEDQINLLLQKGVLSTLFLAVDEDA